MLEFVKKDHYIEGSVAFCQVYIPRIDYPQLKQHIDNDSDIIELNINNARRKISARAIRLMYEFQFSKVEIARRKKLGQDCGVFAVAYKNNQNMKRLDFSKNGSFEVVATPSSTILSSVSDDCPKVETDGVIILSSNHASCTNHTDNLHVITRVDTDNERDPIFISKFNLGLVALHSFFEAAKYYNSLEFWYADDIRARVKRK